MSLVKLLHQYANYNLWANRRMGDWLQAQPTELMGQELPSSFPTIARTVAHLHDTETFWMAIWQGSASPTWVNYKGPDNEVVPALLARSEAVAQYVSSLDETQLLEHCAIDRPWFKGEKPRYEFIQHCINHASYHRGQIITMGRTLGMSKPPNTDFAFYGIG